MEKTPLVTCLCLTTAGRSEFLRRAIQCYCDSTYENKELLIMPDSIIDVSTQAIGEIPRGRNINLSICGLTLGNQGRNIGQKRNVGCESAQGEIIALWDDDDFSAPDRLSFQVQSLQVSQKAVTGFQIMKFTDGASWWQFSYPAGLVLGTSLCFRLDWWKKHRFEETQVGEDVCFSAGAYQENQLAMCPDMNLMYATIHKGNTSLKRPTVDAGWTPLPGFDASVFHPLQVIR